ncbi:AmmeMemoRadiSam system radical SAM enzyme [Streptomyces sp. TRM S81-3]|uniref:AmmeMemoRadiSam system radical SAM enzyme n=1 Tax=Streptomyces griseicoloratus TaxID=2752516 RepID=A0A926QS88_9ACTN|nr:AmmeMemoRadiSam system radical SAM enzyme [Streptomyces griseicoloratus]MBD0421495.1 AmmeMemoRadiSam system radical SAM enzyme [Streptomyces griseicoloratus]
MVVEWAPADFYRPVDGGLQCTLCPFRCRLRDGDTGACKVRRRRGDQVLTATRGTTVEHWSAVERKPFYHFRPGLRLLTLAPPGCSFRCDYCVNHRVSQYGRDPVGDSALPHTPTDPGALVRTAAEQGAGIALSYSEPSLAAELTLELGAHAAPSGVPLVWKSNGFLTPEAVSRLAPALAAVNIDVKAAGEEDHRRLTGAPLAPVLRTLELMRAAGVWVEVSTPLIPGTSDDDAHLARIAGHVARLGPDTPWHLLRFTPTYRMARHRPTPPDRLRRAVDIGHAAGLRYVYVERALGAGGRATRCPGCGTEAVTRDVWGPGRSLLRDGRCPGCGQRLAGVWD